MIKTNRHRVGEQYVHVEGTSSFLRVAIGGGGELCVPLVKGGETEIALSVEGMERKIVELNERYEVHVVLIEGRTGEFAVCAHEGSLSLIDGEGIPS
jgi:hypothetical protein